MGNLYGTPASPEKRRPGRAWAVGLICWAASLALGGCSKPTDAKVMQAEGRGATSTVNSAGAIHAHSTNADADVVAVGMDSKPPASVNPLDSTNVLRSFQARGLVRELPADGTTLVVRHEAIPGFMPKMTMTFDVHDTNELRGLRVGDA